ncbi:MAG: hypothetical protein AB7F86_03325 [Bdellovibrionales bacterium]
MEGPVFKLMRFVLGAGLLCSSFAFAEIQPESSLLWRRARVAPLGQHLWSFQTSYQKSDSRFSTNGDSKPLGEPFARGVTWRQILDRQSDATARAQLQSYMRSTGAREDDLAASAEYEVFREEMGLKLDWAYGLTSSWMIGFQMPLSYRRTYTQTHIKMSPSLNGAIRTQKLNQTAQDMSAEVREMAEQELSSRGYDDVPDQRLEWEPGDATLLSQISLLKGYTWQWSLQQMVRVPTSRNPDLDEYIRSESDNGQVDLGLTSLTDFQFQRWLLGTRMGYVAQLPDQIRGRVPGDASRNIDPKVGRDLGDWVFVSADSNYRLARRWSADFEYSYWRKWTDKFRGHASSGYEYSRLSRGTDSELHLSRFGLQYQMGSRTSRGRIESKWIAAIGYQHPWAGRNSANSDRATLDVINYF